MFALAALCLLPFSESRAAVIFSDSFDTYTSGSAFTGGTPGAPWTSNLPNDSTRIRVDNARASDGANSLFFRDGSGRTVTTNAIDVTGFTSLVLEFHIAQGVTAYEVGDSFQVQMAVNGSGSYATVLQNTGLSAGGGSAGAPLAYSSGTPLVIAGGTGTTLGTADGGFDAFFVGIDLTGVSSVNFRFIFSPSDSPEAYWLDQVVVDAAVPEPEAWLLLGLYPMAACLRRRRRKKPVPMTRKAAEVGSGTRPVMEMSSSQ